MYATLSFYCLRIGIRQSWLQKYKKSFATYLQIGKKSNNQEVKEGKISPWRRMRNIQIPISCLLNATDNRTRQRLPKSWCNASKHWCCIEIQVLDRDRRRQFHHLHFHAMLVYLCAQLALAAVMIHATFHATVSHRTHHHLVIAKTVHDGSTHAQVNHHEREHQSHQYVERTFHTYFLHLSFLKLQN